MDEQTFALTECIRSIASKGYENLYFGKGASQKAVSEAQEHLGLSFPPSLGWFLLTYGKASLESELVYGLLDEPLPDDEEYEFFYEDLKTVTTEARQELKMLQQYILVVNDEEEEQFYIDTSKISYGNENPVYRVEFWDFSQPEFYANSFAEFLLKRIEFNFPSLLKDMHK